MRPKRQLVTRNAARLPPRGSNPMTMSSAHRDSCAYRSTATTGRSVAVAARACTLQLYRHSRLRRQPRPRGLPPISHQPRFVDVLMTTRRTGAAAPFDRPIAVREGHAFDGQRRFAGPDREDSRGRRIRGDRSKPSCARNVRTPNWVSEAVRSIPVGVELRLGQAAGTGLRQDPIRRARLARRRIPAPDATR